MNTFDKSNINMRQNTYDINLSENQVTIDNKRKNKIIIFLIILIVIALVIIFILGTILIMKEKNPKINCSDGYFLQKDYLGNAFCYKCSIDKCKTCQGNLDNNTCTSCLDSYFPKYENNLIRTCLTKKTEINESISMFSDLSDQISENIVFNKTNDLSNIINSELLNKTIENSYNNIVTNKMINITQSSLINETIQNIININNSDILNTEYKISEMTEDSKTNILSTTINNSIENNSNNVFEIKLTDTNIVNNSDTNILTCEPGYFVPEDNVECEKCSTENCEICHGTKTNNFCISCFSTFFPLYENDFIISCNYCDIGDRDKCLECNMTTFECSKCNSGFELREGKCHTEYSFEGIYETKSYNQNIKLINNEYMISKMKIEGEEKAPNNYHLFIIPGNHSVYLKLREDLTSFQSMFNNITYLKSLYFFSDINTENIITMEKMFNNCTSLTSIHFSNLNTLCAEDMDEMFFGCSSLTSLNLSSFITSGVHYMLSTFANCSKLNILDISNFDVNDYNYLDCRFFFHILIQMLQFILNVIFMNF